MNSSIKFLSLLMIMFLSNCLWATFTYATQEEYSFCLDSKSFYGCNEKRLTDQTTDGTKDFSPQSTCHSMASYNPNSDTVLLSLIDLEDEDTLSLDQDTPKVKTSLFKEVVVTYLDNKLTPHSLPLFLLNSSFLL